MRKYSRNPFRWLRYFYRRIKYRNSKFPNYYAPKPVRKEWIDDKFSNFIEVWKEQWKKP